MGRDGHSVRTMFFFLHFALDLIPSAGTTEGGMELGHGSLLSLFVFFLKRFQMSIVSSKYLSEKT